MVFWETEVKINASRERGGVRSIPCDDFQPFRARASLAVREETVGAALMKREHQLFPSGRALDEPAEVVLLWERVCQADLS